MSTDLDLSKLSHSEKDALILMLLARLDEAHKLIAELQARIDDLTRPPKTPDNAVKFLSLKEYPTFLEDLASGFPANIPAGGAFGGDQLRVDVPRELRAHLARPEGVDAEVLGGGVVRRRPVSGDGVNGDGARMA